MDKIQIIVLIVSIIVILASIGGFVGGVYWWIGIDKENKKLKDKKNRKKFIKIFFLLSKIKAK